MSNSHCHCHNTAPTRRPSIFASPAFSLVELLAAVAIIGIITFLAVPHLLRLRGDTEKHLAITRAQSLNAAMATLVKVNGSAQAATLWSSAGTNQKKYARISPYLAFAEATLTKYLPKGYTIRFNGVRPLRKVTLKKGTTIIPY